MSGVGGQVPLSKQLMNPIYSKIADWEFQKLDKTKEIRYIHKPALGLSWQQPVSLECNLTRLIRL